MIWDSPEWREARDDNLLRWMLGDADAARCVVLLSAISETWDDLIDGDKKLAPPDINQAFVNALVGLNTNPFYKKHQVTILPIVFAGINAWMDANELEGASTAEHRRLGFYIRNYAYEVCSICAMCAGGFDWLRSISLEMRLFCHHESYLEWEKRL